MENNGRLSFSVLGSGSAGNCVLVQGGGTSILIDAGLNAKTVKSRLASLELEDLALDAVLITHEHSDHVTHAGRLSRAFKVPIYIAEATKDASPKAFRGDEDTPPLPTRAFTLGDLEIVAVPKPHDAAEPSAFTVRYQEDVLGVFTDLGHVDDQVGAAISQCTALLMEANHDPALLAQGPYPDYLKRRVGGHLGHISNEDAARALAQYIHPKLQTLVLGHLSSKNNHPQLVRESFVRHLGEKADFSRWISYQHRATPLFSADGSVVRRPAAPGAAAAAGAAIAAVASSNSASTTRA